MGSIQFIFGVHNHQPVGNFDYVFENALEKCYLPFIEILELHPDVAMVMHFSGCLLEWLEEHHPDFVQRIAALVDRGNIEMLSAGFYEPVLAVIPDHDKLGQILKMNRYIAERFGYVPLGLWLTERVWEPHLANHIKATGLSYTAVDDFHFLAAGKEQEELTGYFNTEEQGRTLGVFPINQKLRYAIPFKEPEETIEYLRKQTTEDGRNVVVMVDDGEKYGVWPGTHENCYGENNWLERFFSALEANKEWLKTTTFSDYYSGHSPRDRVYLPTTSYFEMNQWTLPASLGQSFSDLVDSFEEKGKLEEVRPFLRGGTWRNFLSLYEESRWMHTRMTNVSERFVTAKAINGSQFSKDVQDELWRSQCNCAYWHGIFGGLYLPHLRHAVYQHLLMAERWIDQANELNGTVGDLDGDGAEEFVLRSDDIRVIASEAGGTIKELDFLPKNFNLTDVMSRYPESYHTQVKDAPVRSVENGSIHNIYMAKEPGLTKLLNYDPFPRHSLTDHILPSDSPLASLYSSKVVNSCVAPVRFEGRLGEILELEGVVESKDYKIEIIKTLQIDCGSLDIGIRLRNMKSKPLSELYTCEFNFGLLAGQAEDRYYELNGIKPQKAYLNTIVNKSDIMSLALTDEYNHFRLKLTFPEKASIWCFPIETVTMSESGFERIYQGSAVVPNWQIDLDSDEVFEIQMTLDIEEL